MIPHTLYKLRYKPHTNRLLARIRTRRKELGQEDYEDFFVTGHSSGGHGAQILGLLTGMRAFSFNAPGGALRHALWAYESMQDKDGIIKPTEDDYKQKILAIITKKDPVSALQHDQDPVQPIQIDLKGEHGFIGPHKILPLFWQTQALQAERSGDVIPALPTAQQKHSLLLTSLRALLTPVRIVSNIASKFEFLQQKLMGKIKKKSKGV